MPIRKFLFYPWLFLPLGALALCLYTSSYYLSKRQLLLHKELIISEAALVQQRGALIHLQKMTKDIQDLFKEVRPEARSRKALGDFFKILVAKHHFLSFHFAVMPEEVLLKGIHAKIHKIPIRLHFSTRLDDNVWEFLKELHRLFPGITLARDLSLEKEESSEAVALKTGATVLLKGAYLFDWYVLVPL